MIREDSTEDNMETVRVDKSNFDRTFAEYVRWNKRAIPELVNKQAFEVAKLCVRKVVASSRASIKSKLQAASRVSPSLNVSELIVNKIRVAQGLPSLQQMELKAAGIEYVRKKMNTANFLRAGYIPAVNALDPKVKDKGANRVSGVKAFGMAKGGATAAPIESWTPSATIWNAVQGGKGQIWQGAPTVNVSKVQNIIRRGLQDALNAKEADMQIYIEKKFNEAIRKYNNS